MDKRLIVISCLLLLITLFINVSSTQAAESINIQGIFKVNNIPITNHHVGFTCNKIKDNSLIKSTNKETYTDSNGHYNVQFSREDCPKESGIFVSGFQFWPGCQSVGVCTLGYGSPQIVVKDASNITYDVVVYSSSPVSEADMQQFIERDDVHFQSDIASVPEYNLTTFTLAAFMSIGMFLWLQNRSSVKIPYYSGREEVGQ